jgi:hypothetical protein
MGGAIRMTGGSILPCVGGAGEQPAALMDAFGMFEMWAKEAE